MKKLYISAIAAFLLLSSTAFAQKSKPEQKGSVTFTLDNSKNQGQPVEAAYIVLDKYNLTAAGYVIDKFEVSNNKVVLTDLPTGKYYADIYTKGVYKQHFTKVITVTKKGKAYTFKLEEAEAYSPDTVVIPAESNDFSLTSVVLMK